LLVKGKPFSVAFPPKTRVFPPAFPSHPIRHLQYISGALAQNWIKTQLFWILVLLFAG
jgi:hypothetical protein